jgi:hypothetical protein
MYTMKKFLAPLLLAGALPLIDASSRLMVSAGTPECSGGMELNLLNVDCGDEYCTFGSFASLSGSSKFIFCNVHTADMSMCLISHLNVLPVPVTVLSDLPSNNSSITIKETIMGVGVSTVYDEDVDVCGSNVLTPPAGNDANYTCPDAGEYKFHTGLQLWGGRSSWYADVYGYTMGLSISIRDPDESEGDGEYATCSMKILVRPTKDTSTFSSATLIGLSAVGLTGLVSYFGFLGRRRSCTCGELEEEIGAESKSQHLLEMTDTPNEIVAAPNENSVGPSNLV